jgi:hypothetical protein
MIALSGVHSSCEVLARKSLLCALMAATLERVASAAMRALRASDMTSRRRPDTHEITTALAVMSIITASQRSMARVGCEMSSTSAYAPAMLTMVWATTRGVSRAAVATTIQP